MRKLMIQSVAACSVALLCAAIAASAATAKTPEFHTGKYPVTLKAANVPEELLTFTAPSTFFSCEESTLDRTLTGPPSPPTGIVMENPELVGCETSKVPEMEDEENECGYIFHFESEVKPGESKGSLSILCFGGPGIVLQSPDCERIISNQGFIKGVTYRNVRPEGGPTEIEVDAELTNVKYNFIKKGEKKDSLCGYSGTNGTLNATWMLKGYSGEEQVDISLGYGPFNGPKGFLAGEKEKIYLKGSNPGTHFLTLNNHPEYPIECATVTSQSTALNGQIEFGVTPAFSNCKWPAGALAGTVTMNGCSFVLGIGREALPDEFGGFMRIICPPGKKVHVVMGGGLWPCKAWLPAQTTVEGVRYTPFTSESKPALKVHFETDEIYYEPDGVNNKELCARKDPGIYEGELNLLGYEDVGGGNYGARIGIAIEEE